MAEIRSGPEGMFPPGSEILEVRVLDPDDPEDRAWMEAKGMPFGRRKSTYYLVAVPDDVADEDRLRAVAELAAQLLAEKGGEK